MLTSNLYAGDDKNPATGTKVGTVTIKVPRFLLSGSQELSMNMTGASTTPFEGSALASNASGCDGEGIYAEIIEVIEGRNWLDDIKAIMINGGSEFVKGDVVEVYAYINGAAPKKLKLNATKAVDGYEFTIPENVLDVETGVITAEETEAEISFATYVKDNQGNFQVKFQDSEILNVNKKA